MKVLVLALYAEGPTDNRFLPPIIQRTAEKIIAQYGQDTVDILEPQIVPKQLDERREDCILSAARYVKGYHALIVHSDADAETPDSAKSQRIRPGFDLVARSNDEVCKHLIPLIPVQKIEAWMLADQAALRAIIGTDISPQILGLPGKPALVEWNANPKQTLNEVLQKSIANRPARRRKIDFSTRQEALARTIDLEILYTLPSYRTFVHDFKHVLMKINFISYDKV